MASGGELRVSAARQSELASLLNEHPDVRMSSELAPPDAVYSHRGLLPLVWHARHQRWGPSLAAIYRGIPQLRSDREALISLLLVAALLVSLYTVSNYQARGRSIAAAAEVGMKLRQALHRQTLRVGPADLDGRDAEQVQELFVDDVDQVQRGIAATIDVYGRSVPRVILLAALALFVDPPLALLCLIPLGFCWYAVERDLQRTRSLREVAETRSAAELRLLCESLRKTRLVRGYGMEAFEQEQFQKHLGRFQAGRLSGRQLTGFTLWAARTFVLFCLVLVLYLAGTRTLAAEGSRLPFAAGLLQASAIGGLYLPLSEMWRLRRQRDQAAKAADRIYRYLGRIPEVGQAVGAKFLQPLAKNLVFENITYVSPDKRKLLDNLNLTIAAGQQVVIAAADPQEGKALVYLLTRFIEPTSGRVLYDGEDLAWVTLESLRAETILVGADPFFTGTVRENIGCGQSQYSLADVTEAAKATHAHNFISKLPQGYETVIGEHGEQLTPGQSFRLGLARALLRNPAVLVIDEPTELLDDDTKSMLDDAYQWLTRQRTVIFLPGRMATVRRADRIVLLHKGVVEASGTHADLMQSSQLYRHWEYLRFNVFRKEISV